MKRFVNYRKRGVGLPKGCKNLADLLKPPKQLEEAREGFPNKIRESKCDYCGAPAAAGWAAGIYSPDGTKDEESHFECEQCQEDLKEFESKPENRFPQLPDDFDFSDPKTAAPLERLMHEIEERKKLFIRQRLAERKGPDHAA
ncbi:MAG TPA: hypothetical protein VFE51_15440 [Verrucomicrobiae bacterium]|nr:hypothetical protein [Verrucomicrobiae bacterium]